LAVDGTIAEDPILIFTFLKLLKTVSFPTRIDAVRQLTVTQCVGVAELKI